MKRDVGLWIDHRKAVIVTLENEIESTQEIRSNVDKGERSSSKSQGSTAEDVRDRKFGDHLGRYYEGIVSIIRDADSIWIFGPGEAKVELESLLKNNDLGAKILGVETVDKMTDPQIAAKVRDQFLR